MKNQWIGIIEMLASGIAFGSLGLFGKKAYDANILPNELLSLRFLISSFILLSVLLVFKRGITLPTKQTIRCLLLGAFGYAAFSSCFFFALKGLSASLTILLFYLYPLFVAIGAYHFYGDHIGTKGRVALVLALLGMVGLVWGQWHIYDVWSLVLGISASIFYALYILIGRKWLKDISPEISTLYIQLAAGLAIATFTYTDLSRPLEILSHNTLLILGIAVVPTLIAMFLFLSGLQKLSSIQVSILSTTELLSGVVLAAIVLNEKLSAAQVAGGAILLVAISLKGTSDRAAVKPREYV